MVYYICNQERLLERKKVLKMERERIEEIQRAYSDAEEILCEIDKTKSIEEINGLIEDNDFYQLTGWFELETYPVEEVDEEGKVTEKTDTSAKDDFALYANKEGILALEIPEGDTHAGPSADCEAEKNRDLLAIFEGERPESHDARLAYDLYHLMSNWEARDELGVAPLKAMTDQVEAISSIDELSDYLAMTAPEEQLYRLWDCSIQLDPGDAAAASIMK